MDDVLDGKDYSTVLDAHMDRVLGPSFRARSRESAIGLLGLYFLETCRDLMRRWDEAFDRYMSATDLRSPPRITEPKPWLAWHLRGKLCDLRQLTLKEVFSIFDARVVDAAREARRRVDVDFSRGISRTTRVALRRAAENFFFSRATAMSVAC